MEQETHSIEDVELGAARSHATKVLSHHGIENEQLYEVVSLYTAAQRSGFSSSDALEIATGLADNTESPARVNTVSLDGLIEQVSQRRDSVGSVISGVYECLRTRKEAPPRTMIGGRVYQRDTPTQKDVKLIGVDSQKEVVDQQLSKIFMYDPRSGSNEEIGDIYTGILFTGPPGTGKSSLCKYARSQANYLSQITNLPFSYESISSRDHSKWSGETPKIVHNKFMKVTDPSGVGMVCIDDIDMVVPSRDTRDDTVGLHMTNQLMQELDGIDSRGKYNSMILATTNKPERIDKALIKRRIPIVLHVGPYSKYSEHKEFMDAYMTWADESSRDIVASFTYEHGLVASRMKSVISHINDYRRPPVSLETLRLPLQERFEARKKNIREVGVSEVKQLLDTYVL